MSSHDRVFYDTFMLVIGALVVFALAMLFLSRSIAAKTVDQYREEDPLYQALKAERIEPIPRVKVAGADAGGSTGPAAGGEAQAAAAGEGPDGEAVYQQACVVCHGAGVAGAPKFGDKAAWAARIEKGTDTLYQNAINGFQGANGVMPPKGGRMDLSDAQVRAAVDYMVENSS